MEKKTLTEQKTLVGVAKSVTHWTLTENDRKHLQDQADKIIRDTRKYYNNGPKAFGKEIAEALFKDVLNRISEIHDDVYQTTETFKAHILIHIEMEAVKGFHAMDVRYWEEISPKAMLEKKRVHYYNLFKLEMGHGNKALQFCTDVLKPMVLKNVEQSLSCDDILQDLRIKCGNLFRDIKSIQASIMVELLKQNNFGGYVAYVVDYEAQVKEKMKREYMQHFSKGHFKELAKLKLGEVLKKVIDAIQKAVLYCDSGHLIENFLSNVSETLQNPEEIEAYRCLHIPDIKQFGTTVESELSGNMHKDLTTLIENWNVEDKVKQKRSSTNQTLVEFLFDEVIGCKARCPFCKAPCDVHSAGHKAGKHAALHRCRGIGGYKHVHTQKLVHYDCVAGVDSDGTFSNKKTYHEKVPYKKYKNIYPNWTINPRTIGPHEDPTEKYWKWVFANYNKEFAEYHSAKEADYPDEWARYDRKTLIKDIEDKYNIASD